MTGERIAVIDLGSNTFHLLIGEINKNGSWTTLHKEREYVKLADGAMDLINENGVQRAIETMTRFKHLIHSYQVKRTRAIGTAVLRESRNGPAVANQISSTTGISIEIIDGHKEARYILNGIRSALPDLDQYGLIMDIGGGSVEFILFKDEEIAFEESFKIGVAILYRMYHRSDPISDEEIHQLEHELESQLTSLKEALKKTSTYYLIGASGSFEVLNDVLPRNVTSTHWSELEISGMIHELDRVINADLNHRKRMPEIPVERIDYIVVAYLLIRYLVKMDPPEKLYYCDYALKEGIVEEMIGDRSCSSSDLVME